MFTVKVPFFSFLLEVMYRAQVMYYVWHGLSSPFCFCVCCSPSCQLEFINSQFPSGLGSAVSFTPRVESLQSFVRGVPVGGVSEGGIWV